MAEESRSAEPMPVPVDESHIAAAYANFCRVTGTPEEFTAFLKSEAARWSQLIKTVGIKAGDSVAADQMLVEFE